MKQSANRETKADASLRTRTNLRAGQAATDAPAAGVTTYDMDYPGHYPARA